MTHTQTPQGNQSESDTSCLDSHISDKQDSKGSVTVIVIIVIITIVPVAVPNITVEQSWR